MKKYDVCVIGGGPSGFAAAMRAIDFGKKVILIEKNRVGGAGLFQGALWSKTWWEISRQARIFRLHSGSHQLPAQFQFDKVKKEVDDIVNTRANFLENHLSNVNLNLRNDALTFKKGIAKVLTKHEIEITNGDGEKEVVTADFIVLATGSTPRRLPHIQVDERNILTSDGLNNLKGFPKSIVILGAGVIGCEFATIFSNFGETKVHIIDKGSRILPFEDEDVVNVIEKNLIEKDVLIHYNSKLTAMKIVDGGVEYTLEYDDGSIESFVVEKALISVGRVPEYTDLFEDSIGLTVDSRGIKDKLTQTSISNIFAVGDITADISLVNVGELEGRFAIEKMYNRLEQNLHYRNISTVMFLDPEVASVGMNEIQAQKNKSSYKVVSLDYSCIPRALSMRNAQGFMKILVTNDDLLQIVGMRVVGEHASSAIQAVALLISQEKSIRDLAELIHPHPSIIEGIQECVRILLNKGIFNPKISGNAIKYSVWEDDRYTSLID